MNIDLAIDTFNPIFDPFQKIKKMSKKIKKNTSISSVFTRTPSNLLPNNSKNRADSRNPYMNVWRSILRT
jgi:hypothetical protein